MDDLNKLKSVLRSLVVSSPTQVDLRTLLRDYRNMMGTALPNAKYGYRDPLEFLKERCGDCFLFQGLPSNPTLTLIVPEQLKHIDAFVKKQRVTTSSKAKAKGKRRSVPESVAKTPVSPPNLIVRSFNDVYSKKSNLSKAVDMSNENINEPVKVESAKSSSSPQVSNHMDNLDKSTLDINADKENKRHSENGHYSRVDLHNFLKKRLPMYSSSQYLEDSSCKDDDSKHTSDSGRQTSSSSSSTKKALLEELKAEVYQLILDSPDGVWCTELIRLYRQRYDRELNFSQFGLTSIVGLVSLLPDRVDMSQAPDNGDWRLRARGAGGGAAGGGARGAGGGACGAAGGGAGAGPVRPRRVGGATTLRREPVDPEDALPGIEFEANVFPEDCMHFMESIPRLSVDDLQPGAMVGLMLGEVYSPSHFWIIRLGAEYNVAMERTMDEMTQYYESGEGRDRRLELGAVRVGHYCSSLYDRDWHRSIIVRILDSDTVKVRHIDYGTVERVAVSALRPLRRCWAALPAQAVRAQLAGVRPLAAARRWPRAAAAAFLRAVRDRRLVGNVLALAPQEEIVEMLLIDTSTDLDVSIGDELVRSGHADARPDAALHTSECYLYPRFEALETGATPNYGEIFAYLRDGIALEFVEDYRRHVPALQSRHDPPPSFLPPKPASPSPPGTPTPPDSPSPSPSLPRPDLDNRVPIFPTRGPAVCTPPSPPSPSPDTPVSSASAISPGIPATSPETPVVSRSPPAPSHCPPARHSPHSSRHCPHSSRHSPHPARRSPQTPPLFLPTVQTPLAHAYSQILPPPPAPMSPFPQFPSMHSLPFYPPFSPPFPVPFGPQCYPPPLAQFVPFAPPAPPPQRSPPPPYGAAAPPTQCSSAHGEVTLSVSECEIFKLLSRVDPNAAHWYMVDAISRAMGSVTVTSPSGAARPVPSMLNPEASEFRVVTSETQTEPAVGVGVGVGVGREEGECLVSLATPRVRPPLEPAVALFLENAHRMSPIRPPPGFGTD